jgi:hypothetical protein
MTIVVAFAGRAAAMATALVTEAAMVAAFRPDGIALDRLCVLRATTIMLIRATADLSTERDMPIRAPSLQCRAAHLFVCGESCTRSITQKALSRT